MIEPLRAIASTFTAWFHNPNIHPFMEFRRRLKAVRVLADQERFPVVVDEAYGLTDYLDAIGDRRERPARCHACYAMRLEAAAAYAAAHGFAAFTSTLLISPQQDRQAICTLGHTAGEFGKTLLKFFTIILG